MEQQTILITDVALTDSEQLKRAFFGVYRIIEAVGAKEALPLLNGSCKIDLLIFDPEEKSGDGWKILNGMDGSRAIPVIALMNTADRTLLAKALKSGVFQVLDRKCGPETVLLQVNSLFRFLSEHDSVSEHEKKLLEAQVQQTQEYDRLTGLYNQNGFYQHVRETLDRNPSVSYILLQMDIDRFKAYNDTFGSVSGDKLLSDIGHMLHERYGGSILLARLQADHFGMLVPQNSVNLQKMIAEINRWFEIYPTDFLLLVSVGAYPVTQRDMEISLMCDRALLALRTVKNSYAAKYAVYDDAYRLALLDEQILTGEMDAALSDGQFVVEFQPQINYDTMTLIGAEAMVRWEHPVRGTILPEHFMPLFEKNGFIAKLDAYIWEKSCFYMRHWLDCCGEKAKKLSVAVNISHVDMYDPRIIEKLLALCDKYRLPPSVLRLQVTENVYSKAQNRLLCVVSELKKHGFAIDLDNYGSGFVSLNMLHDVPADNLKIDMQFMKARDDDSKSGNILSSVIRMANWLRICVIAKGVRSKTQADYLKNLGAIYMQGQIFGKTMSPDEFEKRIAEKQTGRADRYADIHFEGMAAFWDPSAQSALLFNSFVGGAAIMEYRDGSMEAVRMNDEYFHVLGTTREEYAGRGFHFTEEIDPQYLERFRKAIAMTVNSRKDIATELRLKPVRQDAEPMWLLVHSRLLAKSPECDLIYTTIENITERVQTNAQLSGLLSSLPGGVVNLVITFGKEEATEIIYFNDRMANMLGYSRREFQTKFCRDPYQCISEEDLPELRRQLNLLRDTQKNATEIRFRFRCKNGIEKWLRMTGNVTERQKNRVHLTEILSDIDLLVFNEQKNSRQQAELEKQRKALEQLYSTVPCGILQFRREKDGRLKLAGFNEMVWKLFGYVNEEQYINAIRGSNMMNGIHPNDRKKLLDLAGSISTNGNRKEIDFRIIRADNAIRWLHAEVISQNWDGVPMLQCILTDLSEMKQGDKDKLCLLLRDICDEVLEINSEQNISILRSSKTRQEEVGVPHLLEEATERHASQIIPSEDADKVISFISGHTGKSGAETRQIRFRYRKTDKNTFCYIRAVALALDESVTLICLFTDIAKEEMLALQAENRGLVSSVRTQNSKDDRNRIFMENTDNLVLDYELKSDTVRIQRRNPDGSHVITTENDFLGNLMQSEKISVSDRKRVRDAFIAASRRPGSTAVRFRYQYDTAGEFCPCEMWMVSVPDKNGYCGRIVSMLARLPETEEQFTADRDQFILSPELEKKLNGFAFYTYILEPDTFRILYANQMAEKLYGKCGQNEICYQAFGGRDSVCENCPVDVLNKTGVGVPVCQVRGELCNMAEANHAHIGNRDVIIVSGTDRAYMEPDGEKKIAESVNHTIHLYTRILTAVFDEVYEIDTVANTINVISSAYYGSSHKKVHSLQVFLSQWMERHVVEQDRNLVLSLLYPENSKRGQIRFSDFRLQKADGNICWCGSTVFPVDNGKLLWCNRDVTAVREYNNICQEAKEQKQLNAKLIWQSKILEHSENAVADWNVRDQVFYCNKAFEKYEISRIPPFELLNKWDVITEQTIFKEDISLLNSQRDKAIEGGNGSCSLMLRIKMRDGSYRYTRCHFENTIDVEGKLVSTQATYTDVDDIYRIKQELASENIRARGILAGLPSGVSIYEIEGDRFYLVYCSEQTCELLGYSKHEVDLKILNHEWEDFTETKKKLKESELNALRAGRIVTIPRLAALKKDRSEILLRVSCRLDRSANGSMLLYTILFDVTEQAMIEDQKAWQDERYRILSESEGLMTFDYDPKKDIFTLNHYVKGEGVCEEVQKDYLKRFTENEMFEESKRSEYLDTMIKLCGKPGSGFLEYKADYFHDGFLWYRAQYTCIADSEGKVTRVVGRIDDISSIVMQREAFRIKAQLDSLTGLANKDDARNSINEILKTKPADRMDAMLFMDIDNFKGINDTLGHLEGDQILEQIGKKIRQMFRDRDIIARFGGDEFLIYLCGIDGVEHAIHRASDINKMVSECVRSDGKNLHCSIGVLEIRDPKADFDELLQCADYALYMAKRSGKNKTVVYDPNSMGIDIRQIGEKNLKPQMTDT